LEKERKSASGVRQNLEADFTPFDDSKVIKLVTYTQIKLVFLHQKLFIICKNKF